MLVYCVTNKSNGKRYIGATTRYLSHAKARHHQRVRYPEKYKWSGTRFYNAIREDGEDNFEWSVLYRGESKEDILEVEREMIAAYKTENPEFGYNMTPGGWGNGKKLSEDHKEKLKVLMTGEGNHCYGKFGSEHPAWKPELHSICDSPAHGNQVS